MIWQHATPAMRRCSCGQIASNGVKQIGWYCVQCERWGTAGTLAGTLGT